MSGFEKLEGTYYIKRNDDNIIFKNDNFKSTMKPSLAKKLVRWLIENDDECRKEAKQIIFDSYGERND